MVLRLAGLLAGVLSRAERATSSLRRAVVLECAERVAAQKGLRRVSTGATGRAGRGQRAAGSEACGEESVGG